jgi:hypothetical protein
MADRGNGGDYEDWFDEPEPPQQRRRRGQRRAAEGEPTDDPWVAQSSTERSVPRTREPLVIGGRTVTQTQAAIVAGSAIVLLLAILAAAGVFSGGSKQTTPPVTAPTTNPPAVTPSTPTTPVTTPAKAQPPGTTLKPGDSGTEVKKLQRALTALGFAPGKADGSYGPTTKKAVTDFQTAQGLTADGIVGPKTLAALRQALAGG